MKAPAPRLLATLLAGAALAGCGKSAPSGAGSYQSGSSGAIAPLSSQGAGGLATKNTTRLGGSDPATDAAAVARAVYPGLTAATRPQAVVLADVHDWPAALAASALASAPLGAPLLYTDGSTLPAASSQALAAMHPTGAASGGAQVIRIGTAAAAPAGYRTATLLATEPPRLASEVARLASRAHGVAPSQVVVVADNGPPALAMPAAGLAAESGAPILLVSSTSVPAATIAELTDLHHPTIYVVGPSALTSHVLAQLAHLGTVKRIGGGSAAEDGPVENAIAVARFADGAFGWGIHEPGHGLVFANPSRPLDAPAAALLSASGDFGPLLLLDDSSPPTAASLPPALVSYLSDIKPAYSPQIPPVRGVYNHGWLIGDEQAISAVNQAEIDTLLETSPRATATEEPSLPLPE
ncbi:MAG TPA: cell wall-binding repeat-containing protein [Solirubrobacteraceae bacterium]